MSFDSKNFSVMAYANGFTLWNYTTADTLESVTASGYFNEIAPFARIGDMILTVAGAQSSVSPAIMAVTAIADGVVTADTLIAQGGRGSSEPLPFLWRQ